MSLTCEHNNPLKREGTSQVQRLLDALVPENVKLHELGVEDWMSFAKNYATLINFYDSMNAQTAVGDWEDFFVAENEIGSFLETINNENTSPHLALFITFLNLLQHPQTSLNQIPKRHLDFYYKDVLRLNPKSFTPDSVHLIFELAKNATSELVSEGTPFEAGKDSNGNLLNYNLDRNIVVNQAKVAQIKGVFLNEKKDEEEEEDLPRPLKYALQCNTLDGKEEPLEEDLSWSAFGSKSWTEDLPVEIVLSSNLFSMSEGNRYIVLSWDLPEGIDMPELSSAEAIVTIEGGWLDPVEVFFTDDKKIWYLLIDEEADAVSAYDEEAHERKIDTVKPTLIVSFKDTSVYRELQSVNFNSVEISTYVYGAKNINIKNELGNQAPDTPFMPFGSRPKKNSILTLDIPEFNNKSINWYTLNMPWPDLPDNFTNHYEAYHETIKGTKDLNGDLNSYEDFLDSVSFANPSNYKNELDALGTGADPMLDDFIVEVSSPYNEIGSEFNLFSQSITSNKTTENNGKGEIKIQLLSSLHHELYNPIYVSTITKAGNSGIEVGAIPKEPYTPFTSGLSINYSATSKIEFGDSPIDELSSEIFHITPFGSSRVQNQLTLIPSFLTNMLYVGLENAEPKSIISLLFQVLEGTEDPDLNTFSPEDQIKWSVLAEDGTWQSLDENIHRNETNNFLKSGIVEIELPSDTGLDHHLLESGLVWIRISLDNLPESVSKFYNIHAQACTATFVDNDNSLEHLNVGLSPESITQLAQRKSKIKSVAQPYTSFDGKSTESDDDYYRRISERLRHKDRALTIWDYERLILQDFPQLHRVKCLNHTKKHPESVDEIAPGNVTIVVIPKIKDSGSEYRLKPKVSQNTKDQIKTYLLPKKPMHVQLEVTNPIYEEVEFTFKVQFYDGYDYNFYSIQIREDIKAYISPWILEEEVNLSFGASIYKYEVINFLENLSYVDYLEDFIMLHKPYGKKEWDKKNEIFPSNSLAVLVASKNHTIEKASNC